MMTTRHALMALFVFAAMGMSSRAEAAAAAVQCGPAADMLQGAKDGYGEIPAFEGLNASGAAVTITVSAKGSWTMLLAMGDKLCVVASGEMVAGIAPKPQTKAPAGPGLRRSGLRLISE